MQEFQDKHKLMDETRIEFYKKLTDEHKQQKDSFNNLLLNFDNEYKIFIKNKEKNIDNTALYLAVSSFIMSTFSVVYVICKY